MKSTIGLTASQQGKALIIDISRTQRHGADVDDAQGQSLPGGPALRLGESALRNIIYWPGDCDPAICGDAEFRTTVRQLLERGATAVQVNHDPHFRWDAHARFDKLYAGLARLVDACHAAELPVIEHHSSTCVSSRGALGSPYRGVSFDDLVCRNVRTGEKGVFRITHSHVLYDCAWCCLNHPQWQELYQDHVWRYVLPAGFDGLQHDDIHFAPGWFYCGCEHCRAKFKSMFGAKLPHGDYAGWENFDDGLWRDWLMFRKHSAGEEFARIREILGPEKFLYGCCSVAATSVIGQHDAGYSYEDFLRGANVVYREMIIHPRHRQVAGKHYFANWRLLATDAKYFQGLSIATGYPVVNYGYPTTSDEVALLGDLSRAMGQYNLWPFDATAAKHDRMAPSHDGSCCEGAPQPFGIALLYSDRTAALTGEDSQCAIDCFRGWCEVLLESGLPFFVLPVDLLDGAALKHLKNTPLAIAPNLTCMDERVVRALREFTSDGGHLIATHETSGRDERGNRRPQLALGDVFGVDALRITQTYGLPFFVEKQFGADQSGWIDRKLPHVLGQPNDPPRSRIHGWVERYNSCAIRPPSPALIEHQFGRGKCLYFSGLIGSAAAETGVRAVEGGGFDGSSSIAQSASDGGAVWIDDRDPHCRQLMLHAIRFMSPLPWPVEITRKPRGFFAHIRKLPDTIAVHFVDVRADSLRSGERLAGELSAAADGPVEFGICIRGVSVAQVRVILGEDQPETIFPTLTRRGPDMTVEGKLAHAPQSFVVLLCNTRSDHH